jgi:glucokinase
MFRTRVEKRDMFNRSCVDPRYVVEKTRTFLVEVLHMRILVGDIGGTKTELSLRERTGQGELTEVRNGRYRSADFRGLGGVVSEFLDGRAQQLDAAVFGIAGPVDGQVCKTTNLPWVVDGVELSKELGAPVGLINDFHAVALGISALKPEELQVLQAGTVDARGPVAIIGAGTGLGEAILLPTEKGPHVVVSEGGHADFAPRDEDEIALFRFLRKRFAHVSVERVVSGPGLAAIYEFVIAQGLATEQASTREALDQADRGQVIGERALAGTDAACVRAVELFLSAYGAEAGNLALKTLPSGGLYLAGGIAPILMAKLRDGLFMRSFKDKGRLSRTLERIRVSVVLNKKVNLLGAQGYALNLCR